MLSLCPVPTIQRFLGLVASTEILHSIPAPRFLESISILVPRTDIVSCRTLHHAQFTIPEALLRIVYHVLNNLTLHHSPLILLTSCITSPSSLCNFNSFWNTGRLSDMAL